MSKANICVIGLSKLFTDYMCKQLSIRLDMFYANVEEILQFELIDMNKVEEICGVEYLMNEERSVIRRVCSYDNTLVNIDYSCLNDERNIEVVKDNCLIVYIRLDEKRFKKEQSKENINQSLKEINKDLFEDRDFMCCKLADISVDCEEYEENELVDIVIENILNFYTK